MRFLFIITIALLGPAAFAGNPFDQFIGKYTASTSLKFSKRGDGYCNRFHVPAALTGVEIVANTKNPHVKQTHVLRFSFGDEQGAYPILEFRQTTGQSDPYVTYQKTQGQRGLAVSTYFSANSRNSSFAQVTLERRPDDLELRLTEEERENSNFKYACYYEVHLRRAQDINVAALPSAL